MHDDPGGEKLAGWTHLAFAALYVLALGWHIRSAFEHFDRKTDDSKRQIERPTSRVAESLSTGRPRYKAIS